MNDMQCCANCQQWFTATPNTCVVVKVRGHKERYYCGECINNSKLSNRKELTK